MHAASRIYLNVALATMLPSLASQDAEALYRTGLRLFWEHQTDAAITALQQRVDIQLGNAGAWKALGVAFASQGNFERAETPFRKACELQPALPDARLYYGRALYLLDRFQPAIDVLRRAITVRDSAEAHRLLALSFEGLGRTAEAGAEFQTAFRLGGNTLADEDPGIDYGVYLFRLVQPEQAIAPLEAALRRHPESTRAHLQLGCILLALDRLEDAAARLERSLADGPQQARAHLLLGKVYLRLGKTQAAEEHLRYVK
jgi:tetratricopeptide (TPR) repeat protein